MQQQSGNERVWENWPGRRTGDEGIRYRLRALFSATDEEAEVDALIVERGREIEEQAARLQATVEGLERREEQAARLRGAVEEMLRSGSAELDQRHAELSALADQLRAREARLHELEQDLAARKQELGAVELRRAAVERREQAAAERERALEDAAAAVRVRERELEDAARELEEAARELEEARRALEQAPPAATDPYAAAEAHTLLLPDGGYRLVGGEGPPPAPHAEVEVDARRYVVTRIGRSGLPGDRRPCAFLESRDAA